MSLNPAFLLGDVDHSLWHKTTQFVSAYWLFGALILFALLFIWYWVIPFAKFLGRRRASQQKKNGKDPWIWGQVNPRGSAGRDQKRVLVVFIHGQFPEYPEPWVYRDLIDHFDDTLQSRFEQRDYLLFAYQGAYWSPEKPDNVADRLLREVDEAVDVAEGGKKYDAIILAAHSFGGLLLRKLVLGARNKTWFEKIDRVVMMASPNRGFSGITITHKLAELLAWSVFDRDWPFEWMRIGRQCLSGLKGAPWVSQLRYEWITLFSQGSHLPPTFQILGGRDNLVSVDDDDDLRTHPNFTPVLIPSIGHGHFTLQVRNARTRKEKEEHEAAIQKLKDVIADVLLGKKDKKPAETATADAEVRLAADQSKSATPSEVTKTQKHVILIVHGIRDFAEWHDELTTAILEKTKAPKQTRILELHSIGYGYFSAFQFLSNRARHYCVRTLVDRYLQLLIQDKGKKRGGDEEPETKFHVIAHSNGTFAVGEALRLYNFVKFDHVYFAGSVLMKEFDWCKLLHSPQRKVKRMMNLCTNGDTPVGLLCWALSHLRFVYGRLGVGGVEGFSHATGELAIVPPDDTPMAWNEWIVGDHNSGVRRNNFQNIAAFITTGLPQAKRDPIDGEMKIERIEDNDKHVGADVRWSRIYARVGLAVGLCVLVAVFYFFPFTTIGLALFTAFIVGVVDFFLVY